MSSIYTLKVTDDRGGSIYSYSVTHPEQANALFEREIKIAQKNVFTAKVELLFDTTPIRTYQPERKTS